MRLRHLASLFAPFTALLLDCATLDRLPESTCGNGVVDVQEDCDSFPNDAKSRCGSPGGSTQCRFLCGKQPNGETPACPDGWGCSVTGICRQPTGAFDTPSEPVSAGVTTMLVGDFDGDGRQDILGSSGATSKGRIHYFQDGVSAPLVVPLPGVLAAPLVYDFDADGRDDIAFGYTFRGASEVTEGLLELNTSSGFALVLGQNDRAVVTKLFPTISAPKFDAFIVPLAAKNASDVPPTAVTSPIISLVTVQGDSGGQATLLRSLDVAVGDLSVGYAKVLPGTLAQLVGTPLPAPIFDGLPRSTCGEVLVPLATDGGARILVYSPCTRASGKVSWSTDDPKEITIPGETLTGIFPVDVDGDGHVDIVIGTTAGGAKKVRVAYGTGIAFELEDAPSDIVDVPLAAGFLDSDKRIDLVTPAGILFSTRAAVIRDAGADAGVPVPIVRSQLTWNAVPAPTKRWTVAQIADVNRDSLPDVIAGSQYEPDIDVLEGTGSIQMPPFTIPTTGSVTNLVVGDFDFDLNDDIAFVQARPASTEREVAIAYGRALTMPPEAPRPAGRLDGIRQVFANASGVTITSVQKGAREGDLPTFSLAVLQSSGERQPVAPLFYDQSKAQAPANSRRELTTRALVVAPAVSPSVDLIALTGSADYAKGNGKRLADPTYAVWVAPGTGALSFVSPTNALNLTNFSAVDRATDQFVVQMVAGDLDGDHRSEVVAVSPDDAGKAAALRIVHPGPNTSLPAAVTIPGRTAPSGMRAQLLDVDGDGNLDLVTVLRDATTSLLAVNVLFGDGKGNLPPTPTTITLPVPAGASSDDYAALGFTQLTTGGDRRELVIVTPKHVFRAFMRADRTLDVVDATSIFGTIGYGSAVVAGDFDGDGVQDLALADQGSIRIARQRARLP